MGTIQKLFNNFFKKSKGDIHKKSYDANELRKGREAGNHFTRVGHLSEQGRRTHKSYLNYLNYRAKKNANCGWAKTKGFTIRKRHTGVQAMFRKLLAQHDWFYEYSDDGYRYDLGRANRTAIMEYRNYLPKKTYKKIWNEFAPKQFQI